MDKVRIAIVGCGNVFRLNAPGYLQHPNCEVYALCDTVRASAEAQAKKWGIIPTRIYTDYQHVLNDPNVDAVELLTPNYLHAEQVIAALEAGKHVSCQKPMCVSVAEADEIIAAVNRAKTWYRVTENFIYYPPIVKAKELLDSGAIGEPSLVRIHTTRGSRPQDPSIIHTRDALAWQRRNPDLVPAGQMYRESGRHLGIPFDDGVHGYSAIMKWVGDIEKVQAIITKTEDYLIEAPSTIIWKFKDRDCLGIYDYTYASEMIVRGMHGRSDNYFEIHGSKGAIHVTRCTGEMMDLPPVMLLTGTETITYPEVSSDWLESFKWANFDFIDSIIEDRQPDLDAEFSKKTIQVAMAAYEAARTEGAVEVESMR